MAKFSGKGSMSQQNILVTVPDTLEVRTGKDDSRFVNLAAEMSVLPGHNENRAPQSDTRLTRKVYKDAEGAWKQNDKAPYPAEVLDKLAECPSQPALDKDGERYGKVYSVVADLKPAYSGGKPYGVKMDVDSVKPGPEIPENVQDLQFESAQADRAQAKEVQAEAKAAEKENDLEAGE